MTETFFAMSVTDMTRAIAFYRDAFGATVSFETPGWTSIHVARVRLGLVPGTPGPTGLHFAVDDLAASCATIARLGGRIDTPPTEVAPGVIVAVVVDSEGNAVTLRGP